MSEVSRLLRLRNLMNRRRPRFLRFLSWEFHKLGRHEVWRKPKGNDNKMRLRIKGYPPSVSIGWRGPRKVRTLHPTGLKPVVVYNPHELEKLNPETHIIYIGGSVGFRKAASIREKAAEMGFRVAN